MKFYYLDAEDYEIGPFDEAALSQAARSGEIGRDTLVRNHMMEDDWRPACRYDFLLPSLPPEDLPPPDYVPEELIRKYGVYAPFLVEKQEKFTSKFNYKVIPDYAGFGIRMMAFLFDLGLWAVVTVFFCLLMIGVAGKTVTQPAPAVAAAPEAVAAAEDAAATAVAPAASSGWFAPSATQENNVIVWRSSAEKTISIPVENVSGKFAFVAFCTGLGGLLVYAWTLAFRAQTFGMWFWGVLAVRPSLKEVYPFRAFCYTVAFALLGWTFIFVFPFMGMSLPDKICAVRLVRNSSRALNK